MYSDAAWIAANFPVLQRTIVGYLKRRGLGDDAAVEAFDEAVGRLYGRRPVLRSRRAVERWLSRASWHAAQRAEQAARRWTTRHELTPDPDVGAVDSVSPAHWETILQLRATLRELAAMRTADRDALLGTIAAELTAMGAFVEAEAVAAARDGREDEANGNRDRARKRLARAQDRLRARLRGWLAGIPATRWAPRRADVPFEARAVALGVVAAAAAASMVAVVPRADPSRALPVREIVVTGRSPDGATAEVRAEEADVPRIPARHHGPPHSSPAPSSSPTAPVSAPQSPALPKPRTAVGTERREPGNTSLVCARHVPAVGDRCVPHPLLTDPGGILPSPPEK